MDDIRAASGDVIKWEPKKIKGNFETGYENNEYSSVHFVVLIPFSFLPHGTYKLHPCAATIKISSG